VNGNNLFLETAVSAARRAGKIMLDNLSSLSRDDIDKKQASDYVTRVDRDAEDAIVSSLKNEFPDHTIQAEESGEDTAKREYKWIIDPLDGTTNYIHGYPQFSVSIGLESGGDMIVGVVFDPLREELFTGVKNEGAFLNGKPLRVSPVIMMNESLLSTGFPFRSKEMIDRYLELFRALFYEVSDLRRAGSAALDLAYLACGRCDGFFEIGLSPWDIAAGSLLIHEAGGIVSDFAGGTDYMRTGNVIAGNPALHGEILKRVKRIFQGIIDA
jgi:myo-inositol-1(or 4)-monophosphatase